jgi:ribosomal-protein-alanine N-acetyltransferase
MSAGISPELSPETSSEISLVRPGGPADIAAVVRLEQECLGGDAWSEGLIRDGIEGGLPTIEYLVAEVDDEVVGHAVTSNAGDIAELQRIAVTEAHRRQGVGARLLAGVVDSARGTLAERLLLEVREDNRGALSFYASQGFVEIDRRPRYYADGATAIVMRRPLIQGCGGSELLAVH